MTQSPDELRTVATRMVDFQTRVMASQKYPLSKLQDLLMGNLSSAEASEITDYFSQAGQKLKTQKQDIAKCNSQSDIDKVV